MSSPQQSTSRGEAEKNPGPGSVFVTKENLNSCTKSKIVLLRCDKERDLPLFKFEYDNSIIAIPDYPNNLAYAEWFNFSYNWTTPIRISFHFVAAYPHTGEVNHDFGPQYQKVLCVSFDHHFSSVMSIFQIASQFQSCQELKIHVDERNIVKNENEVTLQQMHNNNMEQGQGFSNKKAYLCLAVRILELTVTKWHDDNQKMIAVEYDQLRLDLILEFAQRSCPNLEYIRINWEGNKTTSKVCSKLIFAFLERVYATFEDKVRVNFGPTNLKKRKTSSECKEIPTQCKKNEIKSDAVIVDTVTAAADKQQEQRMSLPLPSQTPAVEQTATSTSANDNDSVSITGSTKTATDEENELFIAEVTDPNATLNSTGNANHINLEGSPPLDEGKKIKNQAPKNVITNNVNEDKEDGELEPMNFDAVSHPRSSSPEVLFVENVIKRVEENPTLRVVIQSPRPENVSPGTGTENSATKRIRVAPPPPPVITRLSARSIYEDVVDNDRQEDGSRHCDINMPHVDVPRPHTERVVSFPTGSNTHRRRQQKNKSINPVSNHNKNRRHFQTQSEREYGRARWGSNDWMT